MTRNWRRQLSNQVARLLVYLMAAIALVPLSLVLVYTVVSGLPALTHLEFFTNVERPVGIPGAGVAHAFVGTIVMVGLASLMSIPLGIISGIQLVEYGTGRVGDAVRLACDVMVGIPSIAIGLFIYALLVAPLHHFSGLSGAVALAVLMLPVVVRTTESAVALVPGALRRPGWRWAFPAGAWPCSSCCPRPCPGWSQALSWPSPERPARRLRCSSPPSATAS